MCTPFPASLISADEPRPGGERLLHYCWLNRLLPADGLRTTDGRRVEVINPGRLNVHAGADFFGASLRIGGQLWAGNVEVHTLASDWERHGHHRDERYNNVVLHVCERADCACFTQGGRQLAQVEISVPPHVEANYRQLLSEMEYPPCFRVLPRLNKLSLHGWMDQMCVERMEAKTARVRRYLDQTGHDWERAFFITLARAFGFGVNADVFEQWAFNVPLQAVGHHRDDPMQVEAFFFGQAGMLQSEDGDEYYQRLRDEYAFLARKFTLTPIDGSQWKLLRMRPQNFPTIRLAQLATLYVKRSLSLQAVVEADTLKALTRLFTAGVSDYWQRHYVFSKPSEARQKTVSRASVQRLVLNAVCPVLFAYGQESGKEELAERAFDLMQALPPEDDRIVRRWHEVGIAAASAADSQALIQLHAAYCQRKDCLRCLIGREYLRCES